MRHRGHADSSPAIAVISHACASRYVMIKTKSPRIGDTVLIAMFVLSAASNQTMKPTAGRLYSFDFR